MAEWNDLTPGNGRAPSSSSPINADNMPIGIQAAYTSIAIYQGFPYVACCENGRVIVRKGRKSSPFIWGMGSMSPNITGFTNDHCCSHTCLVANDQFLYLAYIYNHKIYVFKFDGTWTPITPTLLPAQYEFVTISLDNDLTVPKLYLAYVNNNTVGTTIFNIASSIWTQQSFSTTKHGNNIAICALKENAYISFSNFNLSPYLAANDDSRTSVMRLKKGTNSWTEYGTYGGLKGFVSPPNSILYATNFNVVEVHKAFDPDHDFIFVGFRGGFGMNGGGGFGFHFTTLTGVAAEPDWTLPELHFDNPPLGIQYGVNWIASAVDRNGIAYFALYTELGIKVHSYTGKSLKAVMDVKSSPGEAKNLSLAFNSNSQPFLTCVDETGTVRVFAFF